MLTPGARRWAEGGRRGLGLLSRAQPGPGAARRYRSPVSTSSSPSAQCLAGPDRGLAPGALGSAAPPGGHAVRRARLPGGHRGQRQVGAPSGGAGRARRGPALTQRTASAAPGHSITECPRTPLSGPRAVLAAGSKFSRFFP